jgi:iodotyrosine deiodinase
VSEKSFICISYQSNNNNLISKEIYTNPFFAGKYAPMQLKHPFIDYRPETLEPDEIKLRSDVFYASMQKRRSIRDFSSQPIPQGVLENIILTAGTAPSGANKQPWIFCLVTNPEIKRKIREAAESEEKLNYTQRMSEEWLRDLEPLATDEHKEFLEKAPALIVIFKRLFEFEENNHKHQNYYVQESVGLATGILIAAIHQAGLCCLTHTPSPMNFLCDLLERPKNERAFLLIPVGFASEECIVPDIQRKSLDKILVRID